MPSLKQPIVERNIKNIGQEIEQLFAHHNIVVVTAPPGAGKSTVLPLQLLEGLSPAGRMVMLEPRRLAARQIAERMSSTLDERVGGTVGYRVRFDNKVSAHTRIEVLTEGILTRQLIDDPTLDGVEVVLFDEFHERNLQSDVALALTLEAQQLVRPDLKIVIMSATIDTDYICNRLSAPLVQMHHRNHHVDIGHTSDEVTPDMRSHEVARHVALAVKAAHDRHEGDILAFLPGQAEIAICEELLAGALPGTDIRPLYGMLTNEQQRRAILPSSDGRRRVVLATPIAETSLTIQGVSIVVDSGLCRRLVFNPQSGLSHLATVRISQDMAVQRAGRAGRLSDGVCYRLWSLATEHRMEACRRPEIEEADLASTCLDIAAWGEGNVQSLTWLTAPPAASVAQAVRLLRSLGAVDSDGKITRHGRRLSQLPCHPRIAQMLVVARNAEMKALAADVAALLEERDPMSQVESDADLNTRIAALRDMRRRGRVQRGWEHIERIARQYRAIVHVDEDNTPPRATHTGLLLAVAYPERIARSQDSLGHFMLASGDAAHVEMNDELSSHDWIASGNVNAHSGKIFLAAPLNPDDLTDVPGLIYTRDNVSWDNKHGALVSSRESRIGSLVLDSQPIPNIDKNQVLEVMCQAARKYGTSMFEFSDKVHDLQRRVAAVASWHPELELPSLDNDDVLDRVEEWLPLWLDAPSGRMRTTVAELKKIDMTAVLWSMLSWEQQQEVDRLAPTHIQVPTGSRIKLEYRQGAEHPILRVRLQECFGMQDTPCVDGGRQPVLMELLSPGFKPVQLTQDLRSFWTGTYFEVRKELRRRYPKHSWPDTPLAAPPTRTIKRK